MKLSTPELVLRYRGGDRHHLFLNHGTWFVRYSLRPSPLLKADVRRAASLGTKDLAVARDRRDAFLAQLRAEHERAQGVRCSKPDAFDAGKTTNALTP